MNYNFFTVSGLNLDLQIDKYVSLKKKAAQEYGAKGKTATFEELAYQVDEVYCDVAQRLGVANPYLQVNTKVVRSIKIERSEGTTMLSIPVEVKVNNLDEVKPIDEARFIGMRHEAMKALKMLPKALVQFSTHTA